MNLRSDHVVLTVRDIDRTIAFYTSALGIHVADPDGNLVEIANEVA